MDIINNNAHAIMTDFKNLNKNDKHSFLLITKYLILLQEQGKFNFLDTQQCNLEYVNQVKNYNYNSIYNFVDDKYMYIHKIYKNYDIFDEIKSCLTRTTYIRNLDMNKYLKSNEEKNNLKHFLNIIIIINLIKKQLKNKSYQDIQNYNLFNQLNKYNENMVCYLYLHNLYTKEKLEDFFIHSYPYSDINILGLFENIKVYEDYDIYEIINLFK